MDISFLNELKIQLNEDLRKTLNLLQEERQQNEKLKVIHSQWQKEILQSLAEANQERQQKTMECHSLKIQLEELQCQLLQYKTLFASKVE